MAAQLTFKEFVVELNAIYEPNRRGSFELHCPTCGNHYVIVRCKAIVMYYDYVKGCAHCHGPIVFRAVDKPLEGDSVVVYTHI